MDVADSVASEAKAGVADVAAASRAVASQVVAVASVAEADSEAEEAASDEGFDKKQQFPRIFCGGNLFFSDKLPIFAASNDIQMEKRQKTIAGKITRKMFVWMIIIVILVSYALFYFEGQSTRQFYSEIYHNKMLVTNEYTRRVISDVYVAVTNNLYYLEQSLNNPDSHKATMKRIVRSGTRIRSCGVSFIEDYYPQKGSQYCPYAWRDPYRPDSVYSQDRTNDIRNYLSADWFLTVLKTDSAQWSAPFYDHYDERTTLSAYMVPVHDKTGRVVAVLGADVSLDWFTNKLNEADSVINKSKMFMASMFRMKSNSFIINRDGTYMTHSDKWRIMKDNFFMQLGTCDGSNTEGVVNRIINGIEDNKSLERFLVDGQECYLFYKPVKYTQWILVTVVPCKAVDTLCYLNGATVFLIVLLPMLLLVFMSYYYTKKATKPLKQLIQVTNDMTYGKLDTHLPNVDGDDEICQLTDSLEDVQAILYELENKKGA